MNRFKRRITATVAVFTLMISSIQVPGGSLCVAAETDTFQTPDDPYTVTIDGVDYPVNDMTEYKVKHLPSVSDVKVFKPHKKLKASSRTNDIYTKYLVKGRTDYGYNQLNEEEKRVYDNIYYLAEDFAKSKQDLNDYEYYMKCWPDENAMGAIEVNKTDEQGTPVETITENDLWEIFLTFRMDNPQFYWTTHTLEYVYYNGNPELPIHYFYLECGRDYVTAESRSRLETQIENGINNFFTPAVENAQNSTYEKVRTIHDAINRKVDYAYEPDGVTPAESTEAHSIIGVFNGDDAVVCEGYAQAFSFLTRYYGIKCLYVKGYTEEENGVYGGNHAWNLVSFDNGTSYHFMDLTWDDLGKANEKNVGSTGYHWFAIKKSLFCTNHFYGVWDPSKPMYEDNNDAGWMYELPEDAIGDADFGSSGDRSYYYTYGAYIENDGSDPGSAAALRKLNSVIRNCPDDTHVQVMFKNDGNETPMYRKYFRNFIRPITDSFFRYKPDYFSDLYDNICFFLRPITGITNMSYPTTYTSKESIPDPTVNRFSFNRLTDTVTPSAVRLDASWYKGDYTDGSALPTALPGKPSATGTYTLVLDAYVQTTGDVYVYGKQLRLRITKSAGGASPTPSSAPTRTPSGGSGGGTGGGSGGSGGGSGGSGGSGGDPMASILPLPSMSPAPTVAPTPAPVSSVAPTVAPTRTPVQTTAPSVTQAPAKTPETTVEQITGKNGEVLSTVTTTREQAGDGTEITTVHTDNKNGSSSEVKTSISPNGQKTVVETQTKKNGDYTKTTGITSSSGSVTITTEVRRKKTVCTTDYEVTGTKEVRIKSVTTTSGDHSLSVPKTVVSNGVTYKVTSIAAGAFRKNKACHTATIGANVRTIGSNAFRDATNLSLVKIRSKKLTKVGKKAFWNIGKKATIYIVGTTKQFNAAKKKITASGVGKKVRFKRLKK